MTVPLALCAVLLVLALGLWLASYRQIARHREQRTRELVARATGRRSAREPVQPELPASDGTRSDP